MASGEASPLLPTDAFNSSPPRALYVLLEWKPVLVILDWGPLILFYILESSASFLVAASSALGLAVLCMSLTHLRSALNPKIISPKVLDIGFACTFIAFTAAGLISEQSSKLCEEWANALMDGALALIVVAGVLLDQPFIMPYAIEAGLPSQLADDPYMIAVMNERAMTWALAFALMTFVCCIAPLYRCTALGGCLGATNDTYSALDAVFTYALQYLILAAMFFDEFYIEPRKKTAQEAWVNDRCKEEVAEAQGVPIPDGSVLHVNAATGELAQSERSAEGLTYGIRELEDSAQSVTRASQCLAGAFLDDPLFLKWRGVGTAHPGNDDESRARRKAATQDLLAGFLRMSLPLRHVFEVENGVAYCVCVPVWPTGKELQYLFSGPSFRRVGTENPLPPKPLYDLRRCLEKRLRGRCHLYVFILGCNPDQKGKGYGRCALRQALRVADAKGLPTTLETMTEKNRIMYERYGFKVVGSCVVEGCVDPWYAMLREAQ